jgi:hypothetical protein
MLRFAEERERISGTGCPGWEQRLGRPVDRDSAYEAWAGRLQRRGICGRGCRSGPAPGWIKGKSDDTTCASGFRATELQTKLFAQANQTAPPVPLTAPSVNTTTLTGLVTHRQCSARTPAFLKLRQPVWAAGGWRRLQSQLFYSAA